MNNQHENLRGKEPGQLEREFCLQLARSFGLSHAARKLGVSRLTVASIAAGLPVLGGNLELIRQRRLMVDAA